MKILLIAGHGAGDPGACSSYGTESTETRKVLSKIKELFGGYNVTVDVYPVGRNAYADIGNSSLQVNFANYDYVFEIHFNSASNVSATGVEIWVTNAEQGISVEQAIVSKVAALGYPNRGVKREDFRVIRTAKNKGTSAALIETCFISNQGDMNRYNSNFSKVCNAMVEGIAEGFSISKKEVYVKPTPQPVQPEEKPKVNYLVKTSSGKQLGAFNVLEYAKTMASANNATVYDIAGNVIISYVPAAIKVGSKVKVVGSKYATGQTVPEWVKQNTYTVQEVSGNKALLKEITSWIYITDLTPISDGTVSQPAVLKVGSKVKVIGSTYATGESIPSWVKSNIYTVGELSGGRALLREIMSWVYTKDLKII